MPMINSKTTIIPNTAPINTPTIGRTQLELLEDTVLVGVLDSTGCTNNNNNSNYHSTCTHLMNKDSSSLLKVNIELLKDTLPLVNKEFLKLNINIED